MSASRWTAGALSLLLAAAAIAGCSGNEGGKEGSAAASSPAPSSSASPATTASTAAVDEQPSTGVFYEIFVRSFYDSNGDGIGDINGIIQKLDYLNDGDPKTHTDLGVNGIWLMPIMSSPSYHGYDTSDFYQVNPQYGTMDDYKKLLEEAHKRGIKVIIDLVANHTSSQHPWFKEAAADASSAHHTWYTWASDSQNTTEQSATGGQAWHPAAAGKFLGTFWEGMPDLNYDNPAVRKEMINIGQFWLKMGTDGFRLDAAKHIYENLKSDSGKKATVDKNIAWWDEFRKGMNEVNPKAYMVGEIYDNSPVVIAPYVEPFDSAFNFSTASEITKTVQSESSSSLAGNLERAYTLYEKSSKGNFLDAPFLSNHDQDRIMSTLSGNTEHAKMAASLLLTLPGNPFLYYGEEIGMQGKKPDEAIREPMIWYAGGKNGTGSTTWEASRFNRNDPPSVEAEQDDNQSLLARYKLLIEWRSEISALHDGGIVSGSYNQAGVVSYMRKTSKDQVLVVHNVSGKEQSITLNEEDAKTYKKLIRTTSEKASLKGSTLTLPAYTTVIIQ